MNGGSCYMVDEEIENLLETDPIAAHERIMQMTRSQPVIIHKEYTSRQPSLIDDNGNGNEPPLLSDDQIDVVAAALAELRAEMRDEFQTMIDTAIDPLTEAVAVLQGQVGTLLSVINSVITSNASGSNGVSKTVEASETVRRVRVQRKSVSHNDDDQRSTQTVDGRVD
jgi:hypothetical protein